MSGMALDRSLFADVTDDLLEAAPLSRAETMPSAWYTESRFHELDREAVFRRSWQYVGHVGRVARAGEYLVATVGESPVLVVRGTDGVLRAFYNVCRHRGGPLATADGCAKALKCRYHGWTYLLDGSLRGVPKFDRVDLFDRKDYGLLPLHVDVWEGLVFVHLADAPPPLRTTMQGIAERIAPVRVGDLRFAQRVEYDVRANWKVYVDNYVEAYHVPHVHPELFRLYDFQSYVTETDGYHSVQHSTLQDADRVYGERADRAYYYWIWPNFMLNVVPGRLQTNVVVPIAPDRCLVTFEYFYDDVASPAAEQRIAADLRFSDEVQQEDVEICAHVQRGLASPAYDRGRFSVEYEEAVYHFHTLVRRAYGAWLREHTAAGGSRPQDATRRPGRAGS